MLFGFFFRCDFSGWFNEGDEWHAEVLSNEHEECHEIGVLEVCVVRPLYGDAFEYE